MTESKDKFWKISQESRGKGNSETGKCASISLVSCDDSLYNVGLECAGILLVQFPGPLVVSCLSVF